jgi:hypothetical protein
MSFHVCTIGSENDAESERDRMQFIKETNIAQAIIGSSPIDTFANNCQRYAAEWLTLLRSTQLPINWSSRDDCV